MRGTHANFIQLADGSLELPRGPRDEGPGQLLPTALQILPVGAGHRAEHLRTRGSGDHVAFQTRGCSPSAQLRVLPAEDGRTTGRRRRPQTPLSTAAAANQSAY